VNSIAFKGIENLIIASIVRVCPWRVSWARRGIVEGRILRDTLKIPSASLLISIPLEIFDRRRMIEQLMSADIRQSYEVRKIPFQNLIRVLQRNQYVGVEQESKSQRQHPVPRL
jgi:hypothetical protein